ncbi:MAG: ABC transporter permease [Gallionellaceae bacterium]|nr:ABC transporter permease [Gallionellaceae bacterium]MDD5365222.1 ABC transporter permease [Gallionellaceae bacterium]
MVDLALKTLLFDRLRFFITVSGVAFAVTLVFVQAGLFAGILGNASVTVRNLDAELWITPKNTANVDFANTFPESYLDRVRSVPGVARADNLIVYFMFMTLPSGARESVEVYAMENFRRWGFPWHVLEGDLDDLKRGPYIFMDNSATRRFGPFAVGDYREVQDTRLEIVGRTADALSFTTTPLVFMDYGQAQRMNADMLKGRTSYVVVKLAAGADPGQVRAEIHRRLPYNDVFTRAEWGDRSEAYWIESTGIGLNMYLTVFLGVLVGVVVVTQTLYTSTMEHLREYGTVKAIGGGNADIYRIIGKQAVIAAVLGYAIGAAMAWGVGALVEKSGLHMALTPTMLAVVFAGALALCLAAALVSFRKVAHIDPAMVFRG